MRQQKSADFYMDNRFVPSEAHFRRRNPKIHFFLEPYLDAHPATPAIIVDTGAGYGIDLLTLDEHLPAGHHHLVGLEIAPAQVQAMKHEFHARGITNADFVVADGTLLPLLAQSIDIVISNQTIEHIGDQVGHLSECFRVLKRGGVLLVTTGNRFFPFQSANHTPLPFLPLLPWPLERKLIDIVYRRRPDFAQFYHHVYPLSVLRLEKLLKRCGFRPQYVTRRLLADRTLLMAEPAIGRNRLGGVAARLLPVGARLPFISFLIKLVFPYVAFLGVKP